MAAIGDRVALPSTARRAAGRPRSTCGPARRRSSVIDGDRARPRDRAHPQALARFRARFGDRRRLPPPEPERSRATRRARADRSERPGSSSEPGRRSSRRSSGWACVHRRGARSLLQAGVRPALRRPHGRRAAGGARGRRSASSAAPRRGRELGTPRANRARRAARRRATPRADRRSPPRAGIPALGTAPCRARGSPTKAARRSCSSTAGGSPALHCRLRRSNRACPPATSRSCSTRTAACIATTAATRRRRRDSAPRAGRAELARLGAGTERLEQRARRALPELALFRLDADTAADDGHHERSSTVASTDRAVLLGTQMVAKGHHFAGVGLAAVVDADTGMLIPTSAPRSARSSWSPSSRAAAAATAPARDRPDVHAGRATGRAGRAARAGGVPGRRARTAAALGYPPFRHLVNVRRRARPRRATYGVLPSCARARGGRRLDFSVRRPCCGSAAGTARSSS